MNQLAKYFAQGLLVIAPIAITVFVVWKVVEIVDGWVHLEIPGLGILITVVIITGVGFIASNVLGRKLFDVIEAGMTKLPVVKLIYGSLRDLFNAFGGDKKSFDRPVIVDASGGSGSVRVLGFVTCERFDDPQLAGHVAVYLPQSYNFAGQMIVVPRTSVRPLDADGAQFMAFIVSGGVSELHGAATVFDDRALEKALRKK
jgi:uncharacterized membrane protein